MAAPIIRGAYLPMDELSSLLLKAAYSSAPVPAGYIDDRIYCFECVRPSAEFFGFSLIGEVVDVLKPYQKLDYAVAVRYYHLEDARVINRVSKPQIYPRFVVKRSDGQLRVVHHISGEMHMRYLGETPKARAFKPLPRK